MFSRLIRRIRIEGSHFQVLSADVRRLLFSYALYLAAFPLVMTFVNAYLWRTTGTLWASVIYNVGYIIGLPLGFYLNGLLLRKIHVLRLYFLGAILQGLTACLVVFSPANGLGGLSFLGLLYGFGAGLYWGNKNYLSLRLTRDTNRVYYNSLEQIIDLIINVAVPAGAGWFIALGTGRGFLHVSSAYQIVMILGFILLFLSGAVVQFSKINTVSIDGMVVKKPSRSWWMMRLFNIIYNTQMGLSLAVSSILVLVLVGGEGILGTLYAVTAGASAIVLYFIGRKTTIASSWKLVGFGSLIFFVGSCLLAGMFTWVGGLAYTIGVTIAWAFQWSSSYTVSMDLMDKEESDAEKQYAYICDNEITFNIGRGMGIAVVVSFVLLANERAALQWSPFIIALVQLPLAWLVYRLAKDVRGRLKILPSLPQVSS